MRRPPARGAWNVVTLAISLVRALARRRQRRDRRGGDRRSGSDRRMQSSLAGAPVQTRVWAAIDRRSGSERRRGERRAA